MDYQELRRIRREVGDLARRVGTHIWTIRQSQDFRLNIETKGRHDFVTQMDKLSEKLLVEELTEIVPSAGFIAEEKTRADMGEKLKWIVDPIDGTTNFIHAQPPFAISIALMEAGQIVVGIVYEMSRDELFSAALGQGATLNGSPIHVSGLDMDNALIATGFPYSNFSLIDPYIGALTELMETSAGVRRLGSAATDMAYVAAGRYEAFFEYDLKPYDVAAGCLLVTEAGGKVTDFNDGGNYIFGGEMVATNAAASDAVRNVIRKHLAKK